MKKSSERIEIPTKKDEIEYMNLFFGLFSANNIHISMITRTRNIRKNDFFLNK